MASDGVTALTPSRCLCIEPTWMDENSATLGPKTISELMLAGTHDAASYKYGNEFLFPRTLNCSFYQQAV